MRTLILAAILAFIPVSLFPQWAQICDDFTPNYSVTAFDSKIIAGVSSNTSLDMAISLDAGNSWTGINPLSGTTGASYLETGMQWVYACTPDLVYRADRETLTWARYDQGLPGKVYKVIERDSILLAFNDTALFIRYFSDTAWAMLCHNMPNSYISDIDYDDGRIVTAGNDGVSESVDMGATWTEWQGLPFVTGRIVIKCDTIIFASPGGVMRKLISTGSMAIITTGLIKLWTPPPGWDYYGTFEQLNTVGDHIFLCGETGVYKLRDHIWQWEHTGLSSWVYAMADNGESLFAVKGGWGIWARPLDQLIVGTPEPRREEPGLDIFPNPASGIIHLHCAEDIQGLVVYNPMGQAVFEASDAGQMTSISLGDLSPGLYIIRIKVKNTQMTRKFILN